MLYPHPDDSLLPGWQRDGRAVSRPMENLPTRRVRSGELGRPSPLVFLDIRSALKPDLDCFVSELIFGDTVRLPGPLPLRLISDLATFPHVYLRCDWVRRPLEPPYDDPFGVLSRGTKTFLIQRVNRGEVGRALWSPTLCSSISSSLYSAVPHFPSSPLSATSNCRL
ncbi:hypothetical protein SprV_0100262700 [Sparganum proliferum]